MTSTPGETFELGPGELKIGAIGSEIDISCLLNNAVITPSKDEGDPTTKLCGTVVPGSVSYTYVLAGNTDLDVADPAGLFALSQSAAGSQQEFTFTPSSAAGTVATGTLTLDPLPFGGEETGVIMAADFEFSIVGAPGYSIGGATVLEASTALHKVTPARISPPAPAKSTKSAKSTSSA